MKKIYVMALSIVMISSLISMKNEEEEDQKPQHQLINCLIRPLPRNKAKDLPENIDSSMITPIFTKEYHEIFTKEYHENMPLHEAVEYGMLEWVEKAFNRDQNQLNSEYKDEKLSDYYEKKGYTPLDLALEKYIQASNHCNKQVSDRAHHYLKVVAFLIEKGGEAHRDEIQYFEMLSGKNEKISAITRTKKSADLIEEIKNALEQKKLNHLLSLLNK